MFSNLLSITLPNIGKYFPGIHFSRNSLSKRKLFSSKQTGPYIKYFIVHKTIKKPLYPFSQGQLCYIYRWKTVILLFQSTLVSFNVIQQAQRPSKCFHIQRRNYMSLGGALPPIPHPKVWNFIKIILELVQFLNVFFEISPNNITVYFDLVANLNLSLAWARLRDLLMFHLGNDTLIMVQASQTTIQALNSSF